MIRAFTDLHIHSALSPCGDNDMTPNNIVNMSILNRLDIIAVTDHNSVKNLPAVLKVAEKNGLTAVCGMEIETSEEVHMIALFKTYDAAYEMGRVVYQHLPDIKNNTEIFGHQYIMDESDNIIGEEPKLLVTATSLSIEELIGMVPKHEGILYPAHVDRSSYSVLSNLGFIAPEWGFKTVEISKRIDKTEAIQRFGLEGYNITTASDAHYLEDIYEQQGVVELREKSKEALFSWLSGRQL